MGRADARPPGLERRVLQERDERAAVARIAEPEVARVGVVVVAALAQEGEAEDVAVEGGRALEVGADRGDVVQAGQAHAARRLRRGARLVGQVAHARNPIPPVRAWNARRKTKNAERVDDDADREQGDLRQAGEEEQRQRPPRPRRRRPAAPSASGSRRSARGRELEPGEARPARARRRGTTPRRGPSDTTPSDDQHERDQDAELDERERRPRRLRRLGHPRAVRGRRGVRRGAGAAVGAARRAGAVARGAAAAACAAAPPRLRLRRPIGRGLATRG